MTDRLQALRTFVAVADTGGFSKAARDLSLAPASVTRGVASLEAELGVRLFDRTTRRVQLTVPGARYLEEVRRVLADLDDADAALRGLTAIPRGSLTVTAPVMFGRLHVIPGIMAYLAAWPEVQVEALFLDRMVNLVEEGVDVGIRIGGLPDSGLKSLRVGTVRRVLCASPGYLDSAGRPIEPADLDGYNLVASLAGDTAVTWRFADGSHLLPKPGLRVSTNDAAIAAALADGGITRLLSYQVATELESGALERVLGSFEPEPVPVSIVHRESRYPNPAVRMFVDDLAARLRASPALDH